MKRILMMSAIALTLSACATMPMQGDMKMDCCKKMAAGEMCKMDGKPCKMDCCQKMHNSMMQGGMSDDGMMMKDGMKCGMECCKKMQTSAAKTTTKTVVKKPVAASKPAPAKEEDHSAHH